MSEAVAPVGKSSGQDANFLYDFAAPEYRLCLRLENDQLECHVDFWLNVDEAKTAVNAAKRDAGETSDANHVNSRNYPSPAELIQLLNRFDIKQTIDFESLYIFCAALAAGSKHQSSVLARGSAATPGKDGWFELLVKTSGVEAAFSEDEHGKVDLRTRHAFTEIEAEQKIGVIHPPKSGQAGLTAQGVPIPAERGRYYALIAGDGVVLKYDGRLAFAEKSGRALLERQVLSVVDQWVIAGDVDLAVGNIDFHGFVEVTGDVLDDFHIKAIKGIRVGGVVGACRLASAGSIEVGSVAGKTTGEIICHGDLVAGYLNQATVLCHGDVLVKNEIRNSTIKATGSIIVEQGSIVGGTCIALEGIEAKVLGATSGITTSLTAGVYFPDADRFALLHERLKSIAQQICRLKEVIGPLNKLKKLDAATAKRLMILTQKWETLEVEKDEFSAELAASTRQEQATSNPKINAGKLVMEGVVLSLGQSTETVKLERKGPLSVIENSQQGGLRFLSMSPLRKRAVDVEDEVLAMETAQAVPAAAKKEK
jgi:uncharacterized protein (DUF342 family)